MASLGTASLILSANGSQLTQGLSEAQGQISNFATQANASLSSMGAAFAATGFGAIIIGITAAIGTVVSGFSRLESVGKQAKDAISLGIDPSQYQALGLVLSKAGIDASQASGFFASFAASMDKAATTGRGPAALALQRLGVDMQHLQSLPLDQQFLEVADSIAALQNPADQAAATMHIFGNAALLPQLQKGRAGLTEFMEAAKRNGEVLSSSELEAANKAAKAWEEAKKSLTKAWDSVSLSVASALGPLVSTAADVFKKIVDGARPIIQGIGEAFRATMDVIGPVFTMIVGGLKEGMTWVGSFLGSFGQFPTIREMVLSTFQAIAQAGSYVWDAGKAAVGAYAYAISFLVEAIGNVVDAYNNLKGVTTHFADMGASMRRWGAGAITTFGQSRRAVDTYFDNLRKRQAEAAAAPPVRPPTPQQERPGQAEYHATAALLQGSKEAYSIEVQAKLASQLGVAPADLQERAVQAAEDTVAALGRIENKLPGADEGNTLRAV